ncbi:DDE-type integrase/transposase/recombinase [Loktanella sp. M215]|nr:DDE-type integrase/transposase/recombinase [Loktanella sp. M215]
MPDWIASHVRAFGFFGGVTAQVVSDNLKAGVTKACFYNPVINRTYADLAAHYDTVVVPARPHKPKDKAKVEGAVLLVERWILARLRNRQFFSLGDVNAAIRPLLDRLNDKVSGSVRGRGRLSHCAGSVTGVAIEDVGYGGVCTLQPRTDGDPDDRDQYGPD